MSNNRPENAVVLIPSLEPDERLPRYVKALLAKGFEHIVVVDDGSSEAFQPIFQQLTEMPGVTVTLSGMTNMQQVKDNLATYQEAKPLNQQEMELVLSVADDMIRRTTVPCTACHYCVSHCPKHLPIPDLLKLYNEAMVAGSGAFISSMRLASLPAEHQPSACVACHSCEKVCPQQIHIPDALVDFARRMGK